LEAKLSISRPLTGALAIALLAVPTSIIRAETLLLADSELAIEAKFPTTVYWLAYGFDAIWGMQRDALVRIDPADNSTTKIKLEGYRGRNRGIAVGEGAIWIPDTGSHQIYKIDPTTYEVMLVIPVQMTIHSHEGSIGVGEGSVWIATIGDKKSWLGRYSAETGEEQARIPMPPSGWGVVAGYGAIWVSGSFENEVYRIDPATNAIVATIPVPGLPKHIVAGEGGIWVASQETGLIHRIEPATNTVVATFETGIREEARGDLTTGGGYVWATFRRVPVVQIDPATNTVLRTYSGLSVAGDAIRFGADSLWTAGWGSTIYRITPPE
jgi:virginiamycin B lyase